MIYFVRPNDTLFKIARRFGVPLDALMAANPGLFDPNRLLPGMRLVIPRSSNQPHGTMRYVVREGDTLYRIARRFGVHLNALIKANPQISDPNVLIPGEVVYLPVQRMREYAVQRGDTLYRIARKFGVPLDRLIAANPGIDPNVIYPGQLIAIPEVEPRRVVAVDRNYGYDEMLADLQVLKGQWPFLHVENIGRSVEGRQIPAMRLGRGRKEVFFSAAIHANEWITTPVLMRFIEDYCRAYQRRLPLAGYDIRRLYDETSIWIVPLVNPDGVELVIEGIRPTHPRYQEVLRINGGSTDFRGWKANIRGVDLNDQFPANWERERSRGAKELAPRDYPGPRPLSEPESQALANFTRNHNFRLVLAYHSQGEEIYWGYEGLEPAESEQIVNRFAAVSGYRPVRNVASDAGYKDWFIQEYRRPGFTIEVGRGVNPLPIAQFPSIYEKNLGILLYAASV